MLTVIVDFCYHIANSPTLYIQAKNNSVSETFRFVHITLCALTYFVKCTWEFLYETFTDRSNAAIGWKLSSLGKQKKKDSSIHSTPTLRQSTNTTYQNNHHMKPQQSYYSHSVAQKHNQTSFSTIWSLTSVEKMVTLWSLSSSGRLISSPV
jgi:hypothetical protein